MAFLTLTLDDLPKRLISITLLRTAFEKCTPYDCPSRTRLNAFYPYYTWDTAAMEDISMEHAAKVIHSCVPQEYLDRFALYFTGECVGPYEVILAYLTQTLVKT
jgi:hypothetical protein